MLPITAAKRAPHIAQAHRVRLQSQKGESFVSLIAILAILVPTLYGILATFDYLRTTHMAAELVREAASSCARICSQHSDPLLIQNCLSNTLHEYDIYSSTYLSNMNVQLAGSLYRKIGTGPVELYLEPSAFSLSKYSLSSFDPMTANFNSELSELFDKAEFISIGEVIATSPFTGFQVHQSSIFPISTEADM